MKSYSVKFKQKKIPCGRCLMNVVRSLSELKKFEEVQVDLESKRIRIKYKDESVSKEDIKYLVNQSIINGKMVNLY